MKVLLHLGKTPQCLSHEEPFLLVMQLFTLFASCVKTAYLPKSTIQRLELQRILKDISVNEALPVGDGRF